MKVHIVKNLKLSWRTRLALFVLVAISLYGLALIAVNLNQKSSPIHEWRSKSDLSQRNITALSELSGEQIAGLANVFGTGSWRCSTTTDETSDFYELIASGLLDVIERECHGKPYELVLNADGYSLLRVLSEGLAHSLVKQIEAHNTHKDLAVGLQFLTADSYSTLAIKFGSPLARTPRTWTRQCVKSNQTVPNFPNWVELYDAQLIDFQEGSCASRPFSLAATAFGRWVTLLTYSFWEAKLDSL